MIRVLIVADQTLVRQGVRTLLSLAETPFVTDEAEDGRAALAKIEVERPDVVLLDLRMPRMDGIETLRVVRTMHDPPPVLVLTTFDDDAAVLEALQAGAKGYLLKDVSLERLVEAITTLHAGRTLVQPALTERIVQGLTTETRTTDPDDLPPEALTERETEIVRLMVAGWNNKEIARGLDLTEGTVKNHVSRILAKLGVRDRTRAVLKAIETGLVQA
ncbi:MAG: response regulator transcription factor [Trueperaceae bacterium]